MRYAPFLYETDVISPGENVRFGILGEPINLNKFWKLGRRTLPQVQTKSHLRARAPERAVRRLQELVEGKTKTTRTREYKNREGQVTGSMVEMVESVERDIAATGAYLE